LLHRASAAVIQQAIERVEMYPVVVRQVERWPVADQFAAAGALPDCAALAVQPMPADFHFGAGQLRRLVGRMQCVPMGKRFAMAGGPVCRLVERREYLALVFDQQQRHRLGLLRAADYEFPAIGGDPEPGLARLAQQRHSVHVVSSSPHDATMSSDSVFPSVTRSPPAEMLGFWASHRSRLFPM
jgi:hypothetical protein